MSNLTEIERETRKFWNAIIHYKHPLVEKVACGTKVEREYQVANKQCVTCKGCRRTKIFKKGA